MASGPSQSSPSLAPPHSTPRPHGNLRRLVIAGFLALLVLGVAIQFVPFGRDHTNPPVLAEPAWDRPETRALFVRGCADCHSNQTVWPWYSSIAPMSWLITRDVEEGRDRFNASEWDRSDNEEDDAAETVEDGTMPPQQYLMLHPEARFSPAERQALIGGLIATFGDREEQEEELREAQEERQEEREELREEQEEERREREEEREKDED
jgi:mono/diheme cytochrome c family protein